MVLPVSSLSMICRGIADFLGGQLDADTNHIRVKIGAPADAKPAQSDTDHCLNLFFYRFEPSGFGPGAASDEPWLLRLHCLITAFGVNEETDDGGTIGAGENDLRILGEVLRAFHEVPVLPEMDVQGERVRLQVIFQPLEPEQINHLWGAQSDASLRPSVAYEMALTPVMPARRTPGRPLVGSLGQQVRGAISARYESFGGVAAPPPVLFASVDIRRHDWAPRICFVSNATCAQSLAFDRANPDLAAFAPHVWVAGDKEQKVRLSWEVWDATGGWRGEGEATEVSPIGAVMDPEHPPPEDQMAEIELPFRDRVGQAVLYAVRSFRLPGDARERRVRSNPLLVTLYEVDS